MKFTKYHGLGNDYLVMEPQNFEGGPTPMQLFNICHRNFGVGSDGVLLGPLESERADFGLKIFNPDGSEAEKSGNGIRIFTRYLWDMGKISGQPFTIDTPGGVVESRFYQNTGDVSCNMGKVHFDAAKIPVEGYSGEVLNEKMVVCDEVLTFCAATIGNPHCVILRNGVSESEARNFGPHIENDRRFPNRTNVQFMEVTDRNNIRIEIWERGAGYTLASGSSSSVAAAVAKKLGFCDSKIAVHMPGGVINISVYDDYTVLMSGPVTKVADGFISPEIFDHPVSV